LSCSSNPWRWVPVPAIGNRRLVAYHSPALDLLEALIARTYAEGEADLLLELILCYATTEGALPARLAHRDHLCTCLLAPMIGPDEKVSAEVCFTNIYYPLFVAWIYHAVRGKAFDRSDQPVETTRLSSLSQVMMAFGRGDPLAIFGAYADHVDAFGPSPVLEATLALHGSLIREALKWADACRP
jgi:hypothetical protein